MKVDLNPNEMKFDAKGLIPAIVQDAEQGDVLTLAYMNRESLERTIESGETWFYSRSRQELWHKGATSGNRQRVVSIQADCDQDAILVRVRPLGPACHTGSYSCFQSSSEQQVTQTTILQQLEALIAEREQERPEGAYTTYLFEQGLDKILKKVGEESSEVIIAAKNHSAHELSNEAADLLYHLLVLLRQQQLPLADVLSVLAERHQNK
ncbi:phosphoribosyl-ATP pyrophosphatase /phosphoribosyl-AMP cyclohydrolase [Seinonella peptonophila]|uniref:Histidine biosynthesis bifunctional protein HisIE n=1 Tax=Seinonella peptonophila TaxID=112248 RepID=A0A1M4XNE4_9BACL|nr:bifunctional phosphoribosyl-AMP cyclohydrolase/phosphoribosyl-ATP diphosphatase HisIE [Seinonella peptonophila]SHE94906.1 phosphoribosyl-ATP pyrophosphatase /phosphoribosyl-AMP cyclohydrolase [Seinonella peptonophila]